MSNLGLVELIANSKSASFRRLNENLLKGGGAPSTLGTKTQQHRSAARELNGNGQPQTSTVQLTHAFPTKDNAPVAAGVRASKPKQKQRRALLSAEEEERRSATRPSVIITRCSAYNLDRDNLHGSAKSLVDALRYAGYIAGDTERDIDLYVFQKKVPRKEAGTLIEIVQP